MNIREYIESGILELYVAGALSSIEMEEVSAMVKKFPEVREEIHIIEQSLIAYASKSEITPDASNIDKIMERIAHTPMDTPFDKHSETRVFGLPGMEARRSRRLSMLAVACIVLFLASAIFNLYLYDKWQKSSSELAALQTKSAQVANEMQVSRTALEETRHKLAMFHSATMKKVEMKAIKPGMDYMVLAYWDPADASLMVDVKKLPPAPAGMQYQVWALHEGKPIDAGMITDTLMPGLKPIPEAEAFAITLEPMGGSANPTMDQMYVMGKIL